MPCCAVLSAYRGALIPTADKQSHLFVDRSIIIIGYDAAISVNDRDLKGNRKMCASEVELTRINSKSGHIFR